ncbi:MAG TPA: hypothetical protein PKC87_00240 [Candidatus Absconditabacterales bacterium]|nr:hypothetical protein [Candidatus Absconditabacterales bacterium]
MYIIKTREVKTPERGTELSSGIDFFIPTDLTEITVTPTETVIHDKKTIIDSEITIDPGCGALIPTGIKMIIEPGFDLVFDNKSGVASKKGLIIGAKVVDSDYRGEVHIHLINTTNSVQKLKLGEKVAQAIIRPVVLVSPQIITNEDFEKACNTERGEGGFGSTGV